MRVNWKAFTYSFDRVSFWDMWKIRLWVVYYKLKYPFNYIQATKVLDEGIVYINRLVPHKHTYLNARYLKTNAPRDYAVQLLKEFRV